LPFFSIRFRPTRMHRSDCDTLDVFVASFDPYGVMASLPLDSTR